MVRKIKKLDSDATQKCREEARANFKMFEILKQRQRLQTARTGQTSPNQANLTVLAPIYAHGWVSSDCPCQLNWDLTNS